MAASRKRGLSLAEAMPFVLFAFVGTVFLVVGLAIGGGMAAEVQRLSRAEGRVVDYDVENGAYRPLIEFTAADGLRLTFRDEVSSNVREYRMEQAVSVLYDPASPLRTARIDSFIGLWLLPAMFVGLGGLFAAIGLGGLVWAVRHAPHDAARHIQSTRVLGPGHPRPGDRAVCALLAVAQTFRLAARPRDLQRHGRVAAQRPRAVLG